MHICLDDFKDYFQLTNIDSYFVFR